MLHLTTRRLTVLLIVLLCAPVPLRSEQGVVAEARAVAAAGDHARAIALLQEFVLGAPGDDDARVLLGTVLSWAGRYDEARVQLAPVLDRRPTQDDALMASINVELWSDHFERADALARTGLEQRPADPRYLLARARALVALDRPADARLVLEQLHAIDPGNAPANALRQGLKAGLRLWQIRTGVALDSFNDNRAAWHEAQFGVSRTTAMGPVSLKAWRADRFGLHDQQVELEAYPQIRPGTYAYVAAAVSPDAILYPRYRYAADLYQRLGAGFEGSAGMRRLGFGNGVNVYVGSLSKYFGRWMATGRTFITPEAASRARTYHASMRRYVGDEGTWVAVRYGKGASREELRTLNDFETLDSSVIAVESTVVHRARIELNLLASYSREDRVDRRDLRQYSLSSGLAFRF